MTDFAAFREYQTRSAIIAEKERSVDLRRKFLQEMTLNARHLADECRRREEQLRQERCRFAQRRAAQDEKVGAKEAEERAQQERVALLNAEESRLRSEIAAQEEAMGRVAAELDQRRALSSGVRAARERLTRLKCQLEERDAKVMKLETRVAKMEMAAEKRHALLAERLPEYQMPRIEADCGPAAEDIAGESILLIDELNQ